LKQERRASADVTFFAGQPAGLAPRAAERTFTAMSSTGDQTMEIPTIIHLRGGPGVVLACGGPAGLWTRDLMSVTCRSCLVAAQAVTRPITIESDPPPAKAARARNHR
jgi:hypothetical protein